MHRDVIATIKSFLERDLDELAAMEIHKELELDMNMIREYIIPLMKYAHVETSEQEAFEEGYAQGWEDCKNIVEDKILYQEEDATEAYERWVKERG